MLERVLVRSRSLASAGMALSSDSKHACMTKGKSAGLSRNPFLTPHRARRCYRLTVRVEGQLELCIHALNDTDQVRRHVNLGEHRPEYAPRHRVKNSDKDHEQNP